MIPTLLRISWLNLKRDWGALTLAFVLPLVFFSIFAMLSSDRFCPNGSSSRPPSR